MNPKRTLASVAVAAAMTGLVGGAGILVTGCSEDHGTSMNKSSTAHDCKGQNACKGQGGCKTDAHACKGQNSCKGQGGCKSA